ncbi:hypothetical protein [Malacoplasma iowae]|nr:hypothetical protein [Malacoplasma iowae]EGZ31759.1 hypothetical protein GUU_00682 [Malacoplasma iowae 695]WPL40090.1 hypothetical protein QX183_00880 [Malacoplasma iowae]
MFSGISYLMNNTFWMWTFVNAVFKASNIPLKLSKQVKRTSLSILF